MRSVTLEQLLLEMQGMQSFIADQQKRIAALEMYLSEQSGFDPDRFKAIHAKLGIDPEKFARDYAATADALNMLIKYEFGDTKQ